MAAIEAIPTLTDLDQEIIEMQRAWFNALRSPVLPNRSIEKEREQYSRDRSRLTTQEFQEAEEWWERTLRKVPTAELAAEVEYQTRCLTELFLEKSSGNADLAPIDYSETVKTRALMVLNEYQRRQRLEATRVHWAPQRVTAEFAMEVKHRVTLWEFLEDRFSLGLVRENTHYKACCPFHSENTPSFKVWDDHYKCFGCGVFGDVYQFLEDTHTTTGFIQAVEYTAVWANLALPEPQPYVPRGARKKTRQHLTSTGDGSFAAPAKYETIPLLEQYR